jgi:hypothetical protein
VLFNIKTFANIGCLLTCLFEVYVTVAQKIWFTYIVVFQHAVVGNLGIRIFITNGKQSQLTKKMIMKIPVQFQTKEKDNENVFGCNY